MPDNVWNFLSFLVSDYKLGAVESFVGCESPIEQLLSLAITEIYPMLNIPRLIQIDRIENNSTVKCGSKKYRIDILIYVSYWDCEKKFAIECDGHEFHQKTKQQVEKDNSRMRDLQEAGYTVIRFSGTEIYHEPMVCAAKIKSIIQAPALKFIEGALKNGT